MILNEQKKKGEKYLNERDKDVKNSGIDDVESAIDDIDAQEEEKDAAKNKFSNAIDKVFPKSK